MADEEKESSAEEKAKSEANTPAEKPKSDLMMYVIVGVGALVVTVGVMLGMMSGAHQPSAGADAEDSSEENSESVAEHDATESEPETPDIFSELDDLSFLTDTEFAELGDPSESSDGHTKATGKRRGKKGAGSLAGGHKESKSATDSLAALGWLEAEKKKLSIKSKALDEKAKRLEALERSVNQKLTKIGQQEATRLGELAKLYNGMKPEQVARMMVKLNDKVIVAILPRMKSAQAAKILGLLPASRGAKISQAMITLSEK